MDMICLHCKEPYNTSRGRGLCWKCYRDTSIRKLYPVLSPKSKYPEPIRRNKIPDWALRRIAYYYNRFVKHGLEIDFELAIKEIGLPPLDVIGTWEPSSKENYHDAI